MKGQGWELLLFLLELLPPWHGNHKVFFGCGRSRKSMSNLGGISLFPPLVHWYAYKKGQGHDHHQTDY